MRPTLSILAFTLAGLALIEGLAWWWMHPATAATGEPVLAYRREVKAKTLKTEKLREEAPAPAQDPAPANSSNQKSTIKNQDSKISSSLSSSSPNHQSSISSSPPTDHSSSSPHLQSPIFNLFSITPLPEIYRQAAPMLRCTSGEVFHVQIHDSASLHGAFFEWDGTDTGSVLEAFRHMPEACMGAIGMKLVSKEKPIVYQIGLDRRPAGLSQGGGRASPLVANGPGSERRDQECGGSGSDLDSGRSQNGMARAKRGQSGVGSQEEVAASSSAPTSNQKSKIKNQDSKISPSPSSPNPKSSISSSSLTDNRQSTTDNSSTSSSTDNGQQTTDNSSLSSSNQKSKINNHQSSISTSSSSISASQDFSFSASTTIIFDHTVFRDPGQGRGPLGPGPLVHAFRAVWVSGLSSADARHGLDGREFDQLRSIRLNSALTRFRPAHARVIQGAVRGLHTPAAAWAAFEQHMLRDLTFER